MARYLGLLVVFAAVVALSTAGGHQYEDAEAGMQGGQNRQGRLARGGQGQWGNQEQDYGRSQQQGYGRNQDGQRQQSNGWNRQGDSDTRYTANIFNDDEVYGYEAKYPHGEALYVNYRNSDARARRGPGFARSNSIGARSNPDRQQDNMRDYASGRASDHRQQPQQQQQRPQW